MGLGIYQAPFNVCLIGTLFIVSHIDIDIYIYIQIDNGHFASQVNNAMKWRYSVGVCVVVVGCTYCYRAPQFRD